ncbi:glycine zipper family protein [Xanthomarina gelatinilytica]|uniref:glycine zipper family protein n=1 Tax=Xanthomarina gelatinilytica TaxID=1137281 RepID=UPI003AA7B5E4
MKSIIILLIAGTFNFAVQAQNKSIAYSLGLYVFPANNQDQATQDADEATCYKWAMNQTGYDPMNPTKVQAAQVDKSADGTAIVGAAGGAAAGAAIGAIAGDTGEGAAIGAVVGALRGRRAKVIHDSQQQQHNNQAAANQEKALRDDYNKAFTACMEGKGYTVK